MEQATASSGSRDMRTKFASMYVKGLVLKQPSQEDDANIHKLNLGIMNDLKPAVLEVMLQPSRYPEIFEGRTDENPILYHFGQTIRVMLRELKKTYKEGSCPAAINLASQYFDGKLGPQALDEFKQYCLPITDKWVPMPLKGDPEYLADHSAKNVIDQISRNAPFLKHLGLPLLWDGNDKIPALPLAKKQFVVDTLKRLSYLCSFYHQSIVMPQVAWASYNFILFGMGTTLGMDIAEKVITDSGIDYDTTKKYSSLELISMLLPKLKEISSTEKVGEARNKLLGMVGVDAFMVEATTFITNVVKRKNVKQLAANKPAISDATVQRVLDDVKRHVSELLFS